MVGCLGVVSSRIEGYLKDLGIPDVLGGADLPVLLGEPSFYRKHLVSKLQVSG